MDKKLRQSHQWDLVETLCVRCPNCRESFEILGCFMEEDIIHCNKCHKDFRLGVQR
jgi:predicted nucleic acid-binding Zn ribbon protein